MHIIGRGRYAREVYPDGLAAAGAATAALRNRNIVGDVLLGGFTPNGGPIAAILFTPKVSGVIQISGSIDLQNGGAPDAYTSDAIIAPGTGLNITGGTTTINGWVIGVPPNAPVIGGVPGAPFFAVAGITSLAAGADGSLLTFGISTPPQPLGIPVVALVSLGSGSGSALAALSITSLSVVELP